MPLLVSIPFYEGDKPQAIRLANWIRELGGVSNHDCLLIVDKSTTEEGVIESLREAFNSVEICPCDPSGDQGTWGNGTTDATAANEMWLAAAWYVYHKLRQRFFWMEPDAVPTRTTWLDEIEAEDKAGGKPFTGARVDMPPHELHMSGIAVYPWDVCNHSLSMMQPGKTAWDYAGRDDTVGKGKAHFTDLIQHVYRINGAAPTFPTLGSLESIGRRTAVFHRCKDSTLIDRLRELRNHRTIQEQEATGADGSHKPVEASSILAPATTNGTAAFHDLLPDSSVHTISDRMRFHCSALKELVSDKHGRRQTLHGELRKAGLLGKAKARK